MSMSADLKDLKRRRREEIKTLHLTYLRTKRDVQRTVSPGRILRKHLGAGLGLAAILGFFFAPRPSTRVRYTPRPAEKPNGQTSSQPPSFWQNLLSLLPDKLAAHIPGSAARHDAQENATPDHHDDPCHACPDHPAPPKGGGMAALLLRALLPVINAILKKVDLMWLFRTIVQQVSGGVRDGRDRNGQRPHDADNAGKPDVSVADVGTVRPSDFDNFE